MMTTRKGHIQQRDLHKFYDLRTEPYHPEGVGPTTGAGHQFGITDYREHDLPRFWQLL